MTINQALITHHYDQLLQSGQIESTTELSATVQQTLDHLNQGNIRVAENINGAWTTHQWIKQAVLLSFRLSENHVSNGSITNYYDKVPLKFTEYDQSQF